MCKRSIQKIIFSSVRIFIFLSFFNFLFLDCFVREFNTLVKQSKLTNSGYWSQLMKQQSFKSGVLVRVVGETCPHCKETENIFRAVSNQFEKIILCIDVHYAQNKSLLAEHKIKTLPTFLFFIDGERVFLQTYNPVRSDNFAKSLITTITTHLKAHKKID